MKILLGLMIIGCVLVILIFMIPCLRSRIIDKGKINNFCGRTKSYNERTKASGNKGLFWFGFIGFILILSGVPILMFIGIFMLLPVLLGLGSRARNEDFRNGLIVTYYCPHCSKKLPLSKMPANKGVNFQCPMCGQTINSL